MWPVMSRFPPAGVVQLSSGEDHGRPREGGSCWQQAWGQARRSEWGICMESGRWGFVSWCPHPEGWPGRLLLNPGPSHPGHSWLPSSSGFSKVSAKNSSAPLLQTQHGGLSGLHVPWARQPQPLMIGLSVFCLFVKESYFHVTEFVPCLRKETWWVHRHHLPGSRVPTVPYSVWQVPC